MNRLTPSAEALTIRACACPVQVAGVLARLVRADCEKLTVLPKI